MDGNNGVDDDYGGVDGNMDLAHVDVGIGHEEVANLEGDCVDVPHVQMSDSEFHFQQQNSTWFESFDHMIR
ncbi:hypothetical protein VNO77_01856 [Canavalia gladiata]|uniref:Uncharacterized protein n=1 Tax=Canavalia gladiata TaxID=3824 RepID=A0AAN9MX24_CANGL